MEKTQTLWSGINSIFFSINIKGLKDYVENMCIIECIHNLAMVNCEYFMTFGVNFCDEI